MQIKETFLSKRRGNALSGLTTLLLGLLFSACIGSPTLQEAKPTDTSSKPPTVTLSPSLTPQFGGEDISPSSTITGQIRPSVIAGTWYPGDPEELTATVDGMLNAVIPIDGKPIALIVPHAGYVYSGLVAAYGFRQLQGQDVEVAVIIASDHQAPLSKPISVWAEGGFETPLGIVPVDVEIAEALVAYDPLITFDPSSHEEEHPIEIELPFLQRVCPQCRIVPILMGTDSEEAVQALTKAL
ncbi:MAG: AmmeMemoRadiSam system protein B, partial [Chloroflexota bacterium]